MDENPRSRLCYLRAGKVSTPAGSLQGVALETHTDEPLGTLDGVVIDPASRRLRYLVVQRRGWLRGRYLLPVGQPMHIDPDHGTLRVDVDAAELAACPGFDAAAIPEFGDEDVLTAMFAKRDADDGRYESGAA